MIYVAAEWRFTLTNGALQRECTLWSCKLPIKWKLIASNKMLSTFDPGQWIWHGLLSWPLSTELQTLQQKINAQRRTSSFVQWWKQSSSPKIHTHAQPLGRPCTVPCDAPEHFVNDAASNSCRIPPLDDATRQSTPTERTKIDSDEWTDRLMMHLSLSIVRQVDGPGLEHVLCQTISFVIETNHLAICCRNRTNVVDAIQWGYDQVINYYFLLGPVLL